MSMLFGCGVGNFTVIQLAFSRPYVHNDVQCLLNDTYLVSASRDTTDMTLAVFECAIPSQLENTTTLSVEVGVPALSYQAAAFVLQRQLVSGWLL